MDRPICLAVDGLYRLRALSHRGEPCPLYSNKMFQPRTTHILLPERDVSTVYANSPFETPRKRSKASEEHTGMKSVCTPSWLEESALDVRPAHETSSCTKHKNLLSHFRTQDGVRKTFPDTQGPENTFNYRGKNRGKPPPYYYPKGFLPSLPLLEGFR